MRTDFNLHSLTALALDCSEFTPETAQTGRIACGDFLHGFGGSKMMLILLPKTLPDTVTVLFIQHVRARENQQDPNLISTTEMKDLMQ
jgi:hypothetical protein